MLAEVQKGTTVRQRVSPDIVASGMNLIGRWKSPQKMLIYIDTSLNMSLNK